jgi:hypothetical protein
MKVIVSETQPPPDPHKYLGTYWERSADPWHPEAFANVDKSKKSFVWIGFIEGKFGKVGSELNLTGAGYGKRKEGWMAIDWCENAIGFIADGTEVDAPKVRYDFREGPFGHLCAYPMDAESFNLESIATLGYN